MLADLPQGLGVGWNRDLLAQGSGDGRVGRAERDGGDPDPQPLGPLGRHERIAALGALAVGEQDHGRGRPLAVVPPARRQTIDGRVQGVAGGGGAVGLEAVHRGAHLAAVGGRLDDRVRLRGEAYEPDEQLAGHPVQEPLRRGLRGRQA